MAYVFRGQDQCGGGRRLEAVAYPIKAEPPNNPAGGDDGRSPTLEPIHQLRGKQGQSEKL